jgi:DNA-binding NtrC family response regulator
MSREIRKRVFVVDQENVIASTLELMLMSEGFDARLFADPLAALRAAQSDSPYLLMPDVMMKQMNGIELAVQIREGCPGRKVLLFSGQVSIINLLAQAQSDGYDFELIDKPCHHAVLVERIGEALQGARCFA